MKQAMNERNAKLKLKLQAAWKAKKKAPTYRMQESIRLKVMKREKGDQDLFKKGPLIDTAANTAVLTVADSKKCTLTKLAVPIPMETIDGVTKSSVSAKKDFKIAKIRDGIVLQGAKESVIPAWDVCAPGTNKAYYQDEKGAAIIDTKTKEVYECPAAGKCYRLPMETKEINRQEVKVAEMAVQKEREERRAEEMQAHQAELHKPKMPKGRCDTCDANRVDYVKE